MSIKITKKQDDEVIVQLRSPETGVVLSKSEFDRLTSAINIFRTISAAGLNGVEAKPDGSFTVR
jgi:hypothetical protein